ncbi:MAG: MCP four helix bundle domain-containing protein [Bacteroidota bacterium]|nr:MCP four helix bundle domain-containing protein [Candidatus Kapabacteria bacterium]MDW8219383.1 MCP four helix bundle domain-containing protein [Bacteroidota bacterium]
MSVRVITSILLGIIAVMLATSLYALWYISRLTDDMIETTKVILPIVYHASDMNTNVSDYRIREWRHCIATNPDSLRIEEQFAEQEISNASIHLQELRALVPPTAPENTLLFDVEILFTRYLQRSSVFFALSRQQHSKQRAISMMYGELRQEYDELSQALAALVQASVKSAQERLAWYEQTIRTTRLILITVIASASLVSMIIGIVIVRSLYRTQR